MNISAIHNQTINHQNFSKMQKGPENLPPVPVPVSAVPETENGTDGQTGVLRLLQEGHFKGVADVRLRINFHDELAAMENEQLKSVADGEIDNFINTISDFLNTQELTEEDLTVIIDAFMAAAEKAKTDFLMEDTSSTEKLINDLKIAFDELVAGLNGLISEPAVETPAPDLGEEIVETIIAPPQEEGAVEGIISEAPAVEEPIFSEVPASEASENSAAEQIALLIDAFTVVFDTAIEGLSASLDNTSMLPELSEPKGNGGAFEKFLAIYNELFSIGTAGEPAPSFDIEA